MNNQGAILAVHRAYFEAGAALISSSIMKQAERFALYQVLQADCQLRDQIMQLSGAY